MNICQRSSSLLVAVLAVLALLTSRAQHAYGAPAAEPVDKQFVVITEDIIPDVENTTQKVIRVNPLDLPPIIGDPKGAIDSSLYKIQSLLPAHRTYTNLKRQRKTRPKPETNDVSIIRPISKSDVQKANKAQQRARKYLHFLYDQAALDGRIVGKTMRVHIAPGAYPVYYVVSKTNGQLGKFPLKSFRSEAEFKKYLLKNKVNANEVVDS